MYSLKRCFDCRNSVIDIQKAENILTELIQNKKLTKILQQRLNINKPLHHQILHFAIAGCPNSCSQPQIKDFGIQGQAVPEIGDGCVFCKKCVKICPDNAILLNDTGPEIKTEQCLNCAKCARACPTGTITANITGYRVMIGGKVGRRPRFATVINPFADDLQLAKDLSQAIDFFLSKSKVGERFGQLLERTEQQEFNSYFKK